MLAEIIHHSLKGDLMASTGAATPALRHSFMTPTRGEHDPPPKKLSRTPSLPSQFKNNAPKAKQKKRPSGLFESSSDSGSDSSSHEPSSSEKDAYSTLHRHKSHGFMAAKVSTAAASSSTARHHHSLGADTQGRENSANNDRKGLFEFDDDAADSVETLRERVKLRQKKKEHEVSSLRSEVEAATARVQQLESELQNERREKDEFAIRMNECQRLIEKRTKQLIKANEKLARLTEQSESRMSELQLRISEMTLEVETARSKERSAREQARVEYEAKLTQQRQLFEAERERTTLDFAEKIRLKDAEESVLRKRVVQLEQDVVMVTSRIAESSEYQTLLKRCEDAEAITRGLRFQLEKAQNEKKFLKKQVLASSAGNQASNTSPAFMPSTDLFADLASTTLDDSHSPASSAASDRLSNFDFFPAQTSPPRSPVAAQSPPVPSASLPRKPSLKILTGSNIRRGVQIDETSRSDSSSKQSGADSKESVYGSTDDGDMPPPPPTLYTTQSEKVEGKSRPGSGSINFFEKISIKFKRSASSPRNSSAPAQAKPDEPDTKPPSLGSFSASSQSQSPPVTSPIDIPSTAKKQGLPRRPKMYVAKSPSDYEESSDSIFGSDSDSDVSSDEDDGNDGPPPPPPANGHSRSRSSPSRSVDMPSMPPPPPPLFGDPSDDDSSASEGDVSRSREADLRRVILPTPAPPPVATPLASEETKPPARAPASSSDDSDSERSDSDTSEDEKIRRSADVKTPSAKPPPARIEASSSSEFDDSDTNNRSKRQSRRSTTTPDATPSRKEKRDRTRSGDGDAASAAAAKVNRMNEYMEARARKQNEKLKKKEEHESAKHKEREEYEKEWERMAQEERERRRKQQKTRRMGKRRPSSMKTVRVSQMRQHMGKHQHKDAQVGADDGRNRGGEDSDDEAGPPRPERQRSESSSSDSELSDDEGDKQPVFEASSPPLPPEPTAADTELYIRQQARLRERHEMELKKKQDAEEADQVRGQIHHRVEMWAFGKELLHMILTLDQISTSDALRQCQIMVVQSPDPETVRKAYRNIIRVIHPDKLRGATVSEQLEAKELFTVLNQAFEKFKAQQNA